MRPGSRIAVRLALLAGLASFAPAARAAEAAAGAIEAARLALEEQRYEDARSLIHDELARPEAARRAPALQIAAIAYLLDAKDAEAAPYLRALYDLAPAFRLTDPSLPPRVTQPFAEEAARHRDASIAIRVVASDDRTAYTLELSRTAPRVSMACRAARTSAPFSPVPLSTVLPRRYRFELPTVGAYACYAIATDADGLPYGRLGDEDGPVELSTRDAPPRRGVLGQWWFWTIVGAAVAGGATALVYAETRPAPAPASTPPANLTVPLSIGAAR